MKWVSVLQNYMVVISYDGTAYHGFQYQKNALTIQEVLEKNLTKLFRQRIKVEVAGRTDAGVHARNQTISFFAPPLILPERLPLALRGLLPPDIVTLWAKAVPDSFNARRSALAKVYSYTIDNGKYPDVFKRNFACHIPYRLDLEAMEEAASYLIGEHDFKSFQAAGSKVKSTVRTLYRLTITQKDNFIVIAYTGNGFLYKMVRIITGTLINVGLQKTHPQQLQEILESKNRAVAGETAQAKGLCLEKVLYGDL
jgi:tRNA pseudouridine38-40 synthase